MSIAYLGPEGTFTEAAARSVADGQTLVPCGEIQSVLRMVEAGRAANGVVPIENTLEGSVRSTVDALAFETDLLIEAELELPIRLVLAAPARTTLDRVTTVRSHPVALASSRTWLRVNLPDAELLAASSTARAAQIVAGQGDDHVVAANHGAVAAIANPLAADHYGLEVLHSDVADNKANSTRFVLVGRGVPAPTGWDKTSMVVYIDTNKPGALLRALEIFAERNIDITRLESRPTKRSLGSYCFLLDIEGHVADERVADALAAIKRTQRSVRMLGSYPRAGTPEDDSSTIAADDQAYRDAAAWVNKWRTMAAQDSNRDQR